MPSVPPRLLVSVRTPEEAHAALAGGADLLDIKDPSRGSLGMATPESTQSFLDALHPGDRLCHEKATTGVARAEACPRETGEATPSAPKPERLNSNGDLSASVSLSLACGEVVDWEAPMTIQNVDAFQFLKFGLAGLRRNRDWRDRWSRAVQYATGADDFSRIVAVAYVDDTLADSPPIEALIEAALNRGCPGVLFDTHTKTNGRLLDFLPADRIARVAEQLHQHRLFLAAAGSLRLEDLEALLPTAVDIIAVRTAATTDGSRLSPVDARRVSELKSALIEGVHTIP